MEFFLKSNNKPIPAIYTCDREIGVWESFWKYLFAPP